jgi:hypothetical protein
VQFTPLRDAGKLSAGMTNGGKSESDGGASAKHPKTYEDLVWVQCRGYRCLGFIDDKGKWINFYSGNELTDFVKVIG